MANVPVCDRAPLMYVAIQLNDRLEMPVNGKTSSLFSTLTRTSTLLGQAEYTISTLSHLRSKEWIKAPLSCIAVMASVQISTLKLPVQLRK